MKVTFNGGKMFVTHDTGITTVSTRNELVDMHDAFVADKDKAKAEIKYVTDLIHQLDASAPKESIVKRLRSLFIRKR